MKPKNNIKITERLTESELWALIRKLPLSKEWRQRLDKLFDRIDRHFMKTAEKPKS